LKCLHATWPAPALSPSSFVYCRASGSISLLQTPPDVRCCGGNRIFVFWMVIAWALNVKQRYLCFRIGMDACTWISSLHPAKFTILFDNGCIEFPSITKAWFVTQCIARRVESSAMPQRCVRLYSTRLPETLNVMIHNGFTIGVKGGGLREKTISKQFKASRHLTWRYQIKQEYTLCLQGSLWGL